jgi:hypothetical protein
MEPMGSADDNADDDLRRDDVISDYASGRKPSPSSMMWVSVAKP